MSRSAAIDQKLFQTSPQFESILHEKEENKSRQFSNDLIPTKVLNKFDVRSQLMKKGSSVSFHKKFTFTDPNIIYQTIISDSRSTLIPNEQIMKSVGDYFESKFEINLINIYTNSANFFVTNFYKPDSQQPNMTRFRMYEKYIYLICLIVYINGHKEEIQGYLQSNQSSIINWAQIRYNNNLEWILNGPNENYSDPPDFEVHYKLLINSAYSESSLSEQAKIAKLSDTYNELVNFRHSAENRRNSFDKILDMASQYNIIIRDEDNLVTEIDNANNLIFDASYINLGDVTNNKTVAQYNSIIVEQNKFKDNPSRITYKSLEQLFAHFNSISVRELSFAYNIFNVDLSKFPNVYLVFPGIHIAGHTVIGDIPRGTLYIAGKFVNDVVKRRYLFIPNEDITTFDGSQTVVKSFQFYITDNLESSNSIISNSLTIEFDKDRIYNHLLRTEISEKDFDENLTLRINSREIEFELPMNIDEITNISQFKNYINNLEFKPSLVVGYVNVFDQFFNKYSSLISQLPNNSSIILNNSDDVISDPSSSIKREIRYIKNIHTQLMELIKLINDKLCRYKKVKLSQLHTNYLITEISSLSTNNKFREWVKSIETVVNYETLRNIFKDLCRMKIEDIVTLSEDDEKNRNQYVEVITKTLELICDRYLHYENEEINVNINLFDGGKIDNKLFRISNNKLTFVAENGDENYNLVPNDENRFVAIRIFDKDILPLSSFVYSQDRNIVQCMYTNIENVNNLQMISIFDNNYSIKKKIFVDDENYYYISGGYENVKVSEMNDKDFFYSNICEYIDSYSLVKLGDDQIKLEFIKYLPEQFMNKDVVNLKIFTFKYGEFEMFIDNSRNFPFMIQEMRNRIQMTNIQFGYSIPNTDMVYNYANNVCRFTNENNTIDLRITIDDELLVRKIEIVKVEINNQTYGSDDGWMKISLENDKYSLLCRTPNYELTSEIVNLNLNFTDVAHLFYDNNYFKAYTTNDNLIQKYWTRASYLSGLLINPLPYTNNKGGITITNEVIITNNLSTVIYTYENGKKVFHNLFSYLRGENHGIENDVIILDSNIYTLNEKLSIFVRKLNENIYTLSTPVPLESDVTSITIPIENNGNSLDVTMSISDKKINRVVIASDSRQLTIDGNVESNVEYSFNINLLDKNKYGNGYISINYEFGESSTISNIKLVINESVLEEYFTGIVDGEYKLFSKSYFHNYFNIELVKNINEMEFANYENILSIEPNISLNYHKKLPLIKFYQNNQQSDLYSDNGNVLMTIDKYSSIISNLDAYVRKNKVIENSNTDNDLCPNIPSRNKFNVENINNKIVIPEIPNSDVNENNAITENSGYINISGANLLYLSLNIK